MGSTIGAVGTIANRKSTPREYLNEVAPGMILCLAIVMPAYELSRYSPSLDALALSLIMGMVLRNVLGPSDLVTPGTRLASAVFIPAGILLYGTRLDFMIFANLSVFTSLVVLIGVVMFYAVILLGMRKFGVDRRTGLLIASGTAICGASAIAVLSPVVGARSRETSMALIVITTAGLTGALLYPLIADAFSMSQLSYGIFCGSTLQQTGIVQLASSHLGEAAVALAVPVKMVRIAMLAPITLLLAATSALKPYTEQHGPNAKTLTYALKRAWFLPLFVAVAVVFSFFGPASVLKPDLEPVATIFLSIALAGIGLSVDFSSIKEGGSKPLLIGMLGWALVAAVFLLALVPLLSWEG
jgi:uncharacterized integral membrane protein (TIGR00698 family)